jgi:hypothetical protein
LSTSLWDLHPLICEFAGKHSNLMADWGGTLKSTVCLLQAAAQILGASFGVSLPTVGQHSNTRERVTGSTD